MFGPTLCVGSRLIAVCTEKVCVCFHLPSNMVAEPAEVKVELRADGDAVVEAKILVTFFFEACLYGERRE